MLDVGCSSPLVQGTNARTTEFGAISPLPKGRRQGEGSVCSTRFIMVPMQAKITMEVPMERRGRRVPVRRF